MTTYTLDADQFQTVVIIGGLLVTLLAALLVSTWGH